jgi:gamma-glutamyltranspeptidase / glutathione hydrolase
MADGHQAGDRTPAPPAATGGRPPASTVPLAPFVTTYAPNGMVSTVDRLATGAGLSMLQAGGTAADAAVAASAVLAVTCQYVCGMGGDLLAVAYRGRSADAPVLALNASGRAGSGADAAALRAAGHRIVPRSGHLAAVPVPGCVDGWLALHDRLGRLALHQVLEPARAYAADGFPAPVLLAAGFPGVAHLPGAADYRQAAVDGGLRPGARVRRPGVARALSAIAREGRDGFYHGEFGDGLLALGRDPAIGGTPAGHFSPDDLAQPLATWVPALSAPGFGHRLWTVPPNSQGYLTLAAAFIASQLDLPVDPEDPKWAHLLIESARQAAFDRPEVLHEGADGDALLAPDRLLPRAAAIQPERAGPLGLAVAAGGTIGMCTMDQEGMAISLLQSNATGFGSGLVEPSTRIFLHSRGLGFNLTPGHPAELAPGRRPPHTLSPCLVTTDSGDLKGVLASMGGDSQPQILLQLLARILVSGQAPAEAVAAGRWGLVADSGGPGAPSGFDTWSARGQVRVRVEGQAPSAWTPGLSERGHLVDEAGPFGSEFGHAHAIVTDGDMMAGASDPRALGGAAGGL